jgi:hypothetical protein
MAGGQPSDPNPGSRRARLAGAVYRDDRHLDPGTGKLVTDFLKLKHDGYRLQIHVRWLMQQRPDRINDSRSIANAAVQNQKSECTRRNSRYRWDVLMGVYLREDSRQFERRLL